MKVSIVVPTLDPGPDIEPLLDRLLTQECVEAPEVVVVDSGSRDGTPARARGLGARVIEIPPGEFNHGATRNLGIERSGGELVALLSQDARPQGALWLAPLVEALEDPRVWGAYSRVLPRPGASPLEARWVEGDLAYGDERRCTLVDDRDDWRARPAAERRRLAHFNNVASCVRRSAMEQVPFPAVAFGEDLAWGLAALEAGGALVYEPRSVVLHSHPPGLASEYRRHRADARLLHALLGLRTRTGWLHALGGAARQVGRDLAYLADRPLPERIGWGAYSPLLRGAQALGQLRGSRDV